MVSLRINCIILDNDVLSRMIIVKILQKNYPEIEIIEHCQVSESVYTSILENKPQLVIIDVSSIDGVEFKLLEMFELIDFKIIFVASVPDFALQAFQFGASDYLLKPVKEKELRAAVKKVQSEILLESSWKNKQVLPEDENLAPVVMPSFVIFHRKGFDVVKFSDIIYCEANAYCTNFYISGNKTICSSRNLKYYEELLPSSQFMRVHHSYIINIHHVVGYTNHEEILLAENLRCSLSGSHKHSFLQLFRKSN